MPTGCCLARMSRATCWQLRVARADTDNGGLDRAPRRVRSYFAWFIAQWSRSLVTGGCPPERWTKWRVDIQGDRHGRSDGQVAAPVTDAEVALMVEFLLRWQRRCRRATLAMVETEELHDADCVRFWVVHWKVFDGGEGLGFALAKRVVRTDCDYSAARWSHGDRRRRLLLDRRNTRATPVFCAVTVLSSHGGLPHRRRSPGHGLSEILRRSIREVAGRGQRLGFTEGQRNWSGPSDAE